MLFLWIFGSLIEDAIRPWGLAAVYFGGGVLAALSHIGITHATGGDLDVPMPLTVFRPQPRTGNRTAVITPV